MTIMSRIYLKNYLKICTMEYLIMREILYSYRISSFDRQHRINKANKFFKIF